MKDNFICNLDAIMHYSLDNHFCLNLHNVGEETGLFLCYSPNSYVFLKLC